MISLIKCSEDVKTLNEADSISNESSQGALKQQSEQSTNQLSSNTFDFRGDKTSRSGKWDNGEHLKFVEACLKHGNNWSKVFYLLRKVQEELKSRSSAQIRSHAQKFIIKICRKYNVKMKSKKNRNPKHLEIFNKLGGLSFQDFEEDERRFLESFRYYNIELKPFCIQKFHKLHNNGECRHSFNNKKTEKMLKSRIFHITKVHRKKMPHESVLSPFNDVQKISQNSFLPLISMKEITPIDPSISSLGNNLEQHPVIAASEQMLNYINTGMQMQQMIWNDYYNSNLMLYYTQMNQMFYTNLIESIIASDTKQV